MKKKVVITGSSGMVGGLLLQLCIQNEEVAEVISLVRKASSIQHPKYKEVIVTDFLQYESLAHHFYNVDIIYYCLGAYTGSVNAETFRTINFYYPFNLAKIIHEVSPMATFCLLSGQGADRTEKSKMQFARDKGAIENALSTLHFKSFYSFRPGYIYPTKKRREPNFFYKLSRILYPILKLLGDNLSITDIQLATIMFEVGMKGHVNEILENKDMRRLRLQRD